MPYAAIAASTEIAKHNALSRSDSGERFLPFSSAGPPAPPPSTTGQRVRSPIRDTGASRAGGVAARSEPGRASVGRAGNTGGAGSRFGAGVDIVRGIGPWAP